jgi:thiamine pyrophosphate-dependent acetolactate synthase large subunit-like protein
MNASELFVKALENEGVAVIYGVPGEETRKAALILCIKLNVGYWY